MGDGSVLRDLYAGELLEEVFQHVVLGGLERGGVVFQGILFHHDGIADRGDAGCIKHLLVGIQLDLAEVQVALYLYLLLISLIAKEFRTEDIIAATHFPDGHVAALGAEVVVIRLLGSFLGNRDGGKRYGLAVGRIQQLCRNNVLGTKAGRNEQAGDQGEGFSNLYHNYG